MSIKKEFVDDIKFATGSRTDDLDMRPSIELWPGEDDFAEWLACHEASRRTVICNTPEFRDTPFCGTGFH